MCSGAGTTALGDQVIVGISQSSGVPKFLNPSLHADRPVEDKVWVQGIHRVHPELSDAEWNCTAGALDFIGRLPRGQDSVGHPH